MLQDVISRHVPAVGENLDSVVDIHKEIGLRLGTYGRYDATGASWDKDILKKLFEAGIEKRMVDGDEFYVIPAAS